jgi:hypothetical protein
MRNKGSVALDAIDRRELERGLALLEPYFVV